MRILLHYVHPAPQKSRANRALLAAARGVPGVTVNDLYECYPDFHLDVAREQALLLEHEVVVFQHPFYWYSAPALLKEWQDLVLTLGFAYGPGGTKLEGKTLGSALTTGGPAEAYSASGHNRFTIAALLAPFDQTAHLCGMRYAEPFVVYAAPRLSAAELRAEATRYAGWLRGLGRHHAGEETPVSEVRF
jgi:glutathione-regulated potassium-efflux system ancillary protein KefG